MHDIVLFSRRGAQRRVPAAVPSACFPKSSLYAPISFRAVAASLQTFCAWMDKGQAFGRAT